MRNKVYDRRQKAVITRSSKQFVLNSGLASARSFDALRRRRNELEYPQRPEDGATSEEAAEAVEQAERIIATAGLLLHGLGLF